MQLILYSTVPIIRHSHTISEIATPTKESKHILEDELSSEDTEQCFFLLWTISF